MALRKSPDLTAMEALGWEIEQRWRQADVELYARCMVELCGGLVTENFGATSKNDGLSQTFAMRTLEKVDEIPLEIECRLLAFVRFDIDPEGNTVEGEVLAKRRRETMKLWLHGWQRLEKSIDPNWDPEDTGVVNVIPPNGLRPGAPPSAIEDPQLRAEYEAAIDANRRKLQTYHEQYGARRLMKWWRPTAERRILWAYMRPPERKGELEQLLVQFEVDPATVQTMLEAVETGQMPEHLTRRITTQPSKP